MADPVQKSLLYAMLGILLVSLVNSTGYSQNSIKLDLHTVAKTAAERNLEIKIAKEDVEIAKNKLKEANAYGNGKAEIKATYYRLDGPITTTTPPMAIPDELAQLLGALAAKNGIQIPGGSTVISVPPIQIAPEAPMHLTLQAGYPLFTSGKLSYAQKRAEYGIDAFSQIADDTKDAAIYNSTTLYLGTLLAREALAVNRDALESYRKHLEQANISYQSGVVAEYDVIRARTAVKEQESKVASAQSLYELSLSALSTALSLEQIENVELTGNLFETPVIEDKQTLQDEAVASSKLVKALEAKSRSLEMAGKYEKASSKPQVAAVASAELLTGNLSQTDPKWLVGLQASMDIFDGGVTEARIAQKHSEKARTDLQLQSIKDQIRLAVKSSLLEIDAALSSLESSRQARILAVESLRLASRRFEVGAGTSLEVLDANVSVAAARVGELQSLYQLDRAYLKLHRYLGDISQVCQEVQK